MHGVPSNLPLQQFVGATLDQICIGEHQLQFHFSTCVSTTEYQQGKFPEPRSICVANDWEFRDAAGDILDQVQEHSRRATYSIHRLLSQRITAFAIDPPRSFTLTFEAGATLIIFDDASIPYESFSIQPGDIYV